MVKSDSLSEHNTVRLASPKSIEFGSIVSSASRSDSLYTDAFARLIFNLLERLEDFFRKISEGRTS